MVLARHGLGWPLAELAVMRDAYVLGRIWIGMAKGFAGHSLGEPCSGPAMGLADYGLGWACN